MQANNKSTNVRDIPRPSSSGGHPSKPPSLRPLRGALRALNLISPSLAAQWAFRLFTTPRRHVRPAREQRLLQEASVLDFISRGRVLRGWSWGQGPAIMLVHGWEGRGAQLGAFVQPLVQAGYRVVTFDAPAHGQSAGRRMTPLDQARAMSALAQWVGGVHAVIAHSMGSLSTSLALQDGLHLERLVFVAPGSHPGEATERMGQVLDLPPSVVMGVREALAARLGQTWQQLADSDPFAGHEVPLFVAHDVGDRDVPIDAAERLCSSWGPATLYRTAGLGHRRILRDPDVVLRAVEFIGPPPAPAHESPWQSFLRLDHPLV